MEFYSPKNFKKGRHISGRFRPVDLVLLLTTIGIVVPLALFIITRDDVNIPLFLLSLLPLGIVLVLIQPFPPVYHNIMLYFQVLYGYIKKQKKYIWGGIAKYEEKINDEG